MRLDSLLVLYRLNYLKFFQITNYLFFTLPVFKNYARPKDWKKDLWELDPGNPNNNGLQNEDLIVWMRTAALPTFRKLYRRIDHSKSEYEKGLPNGSYTLEVIYCKFNFGFKKIRSTQDGDKDSVLFSSIQSQIF